MLETHLDPIAFATTLLISILAGVGFGLTPALQATRPMMVLALRGDGSGASEAQGGSRLRTILVTSQVALSVILLVATAVVVRSLSDALRADPGFARNVAIATIECLAGTPIRYAAGDCSGSRARGSPACRPSKLSRGFQFRRSAARALAGLSSTLAGRERSRARTSR